MKRLQELSISIAFMVILLLPMAEALFHFTPEMKNKENRALASKPTFDTSFLKTYPKEFDTYYNDNFELRNQYLLFNSWLKLDMIGVAPIGKKSIFGDEGWMYSLDNMNKVYLGKNVYDQDKLKRFYRILKYRKNYLDSIHCKFYFVIAPVKLSTYPDFLPVSKYIDKQVSLTDQIVELMDTINGITLVDLRPVLDSARGDIRMFQKTDSHWNDYGSYLAYKAIMKTLQKDYPELSSHNIANYTIDTIRVDGMNMTNMLGIHHKIYEDKITFKPTYEQISTEGHKRGYPIPKWFPLKHEYELVYNTKNDSLPKLLMIRDSFARTVIPFMKDHFSESVYIFDGWHHDFNEAIVAKENPDIYIQLVLESQIPNLYNNAKKRK